MRLGKPLAVALVALAVAGFTIADDDEHRYKRPKRLAVPADAPQIWKDECASCHMLYSRGLLPAEAWRRQMDTLNDHYDSNASLEPEEEREIRAFLLRASARNRLPVEPAKISGEPSPRKGRQRIRCAAHQGGNARSSRV